jgi:hypothetical protein
MVQRAIQDVAADGALGEPGSLVGAGRGRGADLPGPQARQQHAPAVDDDLAQGSRREFVGGKGWDFPGVLIQLIQLPAVMKRRTYGESPGAPRRKWPDGPSPRNSENHASCSTSSLRIASARS